MTRDLLSFLKDHRDPDGFIHDIFDLDSFCDVSDKSGVYIIVSQGQKFVYPNGESRVIYVGMSSCLSSRLRQHHRLALEIRNLKKADRKNDWYYSRYQYISSYGAKIYYFTTRGLQNPKNMEEKIIGRFYDRYLSLPVGNGAFSFSH